MKRLALALPLLLLVGCTEETKIEESDSNDRKPATVVTDAENTPTENVNETPTNEQEYEESDEATEPLQYEQPIATTEIGKLYETMLINMTLPNLTSYTAQVAVNEQMEWEEMGHPNTQVVTLGATIQAQNGDTYKRYMVGEYIQEMNDLRENASISAYEELDDEYAAYFNEGTQWYRTDPTTLKEQIAVGFYFESVDMLLSHFEASADELSLASETNSAATFTLSLDEDEVTAILKKLLQRDDYDVLAPFNTVANTISMTISKGEKPVLQELQVELTAQTATGSLTHESSMTFTALNEAVNVAAPVDIENAEVFQAY